MTTTATRGAPTISSRRRSIDWWLNAQRVIALLVILALWQLAVMAGLLPSITPTVTEVLAAIGGALVSSNFWEALGHTVLVATTGWLISCVIGVVGGLLIGALKWVDRSTSIIVEFGRAFPTIALMPVVLLLLGATTTMQITMVVLAAVWPVMVQSIVGARRLEAGVVDMAKTYRIPAGLWFRRILLPSSLPFVVTGIRISASISILVAVGVEVLTQVPGIGRIITLAQEAHRWDQAFAYLFFAGIFGWLITVLLSAAEGKLLAWNRRNEDG